MIVLIILLVFFVLVAIGCFATSENVNEMDAKDRQLFFGAGALFAIAAIVDWFLILMYVMPG